MKCTEGLLLLRRSNYSNYSRGSKTQGAKSTACGNKIRLSNKQIDRKRALIEAGCVDPYIAKKKKKRKRAVEKWK